jgi:2-polyprenyl-6-methoxyphenol hydroxylase-like FAD-dependent oxidoreductase
MRVAVVGGGPAGLYFAYLCKKHRPDADIRIFEQNPSGVTWGFGVVFSDRALEFLRDGDPDTCGLITPHLEMWDDITIVHRDERVRIDGIGFAAIGRLALLQLLLQQVRSVGIEPQFDHAVPSIESLGEMDLIVGADGLNSVVRRSDEAAFGSTLAYLSNKFVWYGTTQRFDTLTQTFRDTPHGAFTAHHYRYAPGMSTFIVECDAATWDRAGFAAMDPDATKAHCEQVFATDLGGRPLVSNRSIWRNFPQLWCSRWAVGNKVLVGDALHTAHFSIGSGTRLALEDVAALVRSLEEHPGKLRAALDHYQAVRQPIVETLVAAAAASARWYESMAAHMALEPLDFAYSYISRSGRVDPDRLRQMAPHFMRAYDAARRASSGR